MLQASCPAIKLYHPKPRVSLSDFYTETIGPVALPGSSKMLRNPVLKYFSLSLFLCLPSQFLKNLTHFTMVSGSFCDEGILGLDGGVAADHHGSLLKWLQLWLTCAGPLAM